MILRSVSLLVTAAMLVLVAAAPVSAAPTEACTKGDVQALASGGAPIVKQSDRDSTHGNATTWPSCQFRLYDGNDDEENPDNPEIPNVFKSTDWFLGGIFQWVSRADMEARGLDRAGAIASLDDIEDHLFWWKEGDEAETELLLRQTSRRSVRAPWGELLPVIQHRYHIFAAGSLEPGIYHWRWVNIDPWYDPPEFFAYGTVQIVP